MPEQIDLASESDFLLGPLLVRPSVREVIHPGGRRELLEPRVMQVLVVLAQAGGTVSRDHLIELCWSGRIVGDDAINRVIGRLRRLGESVGEPAFEIETVTKVGFRLTVHDAPLDAAASAPPTPPPDELVGAAPEPPGARPDRRALLLTAGGGALVIGAGAAGVYIWRREAVTAAPRIAVMPFANLSGDPAQAYFSDGLAEDLRGALARLPKATVVGRTSSEKLRNDDAVAVAKALDATHILTGSVRRSASLIRVTVQLVDGATGVERWSQSYDRAPGDTLTIQTDVAQRVAEALSITLGLLDKAALAAGGTANAGAHDLYLRAAEVFFRSGTKEDTRRALELSDGALTLDPTYADAHVLRANAILNLTVWFKDISGRSQGGLHEAELASRRAIAFAPQLAMGRAMLGRALYEQLKPRGAMAENEKGRTLPGNGRMMRFYGIFLSRIGHAKDALATFAAGTLDPLDSDSWVDQAWVYSNVGRYEDSLAAAKKSLELAPNGQVYGWQFYGDALIELGRIREGLAALAHMPPDTPQRLSGEITAYQKLGDQAAADRTMTHLRHVSGDTMDEVVARFYARQGKFEPALQALERAWAARDPWLIDLPIEDPLKPLHNEPRFMAIWNAIDFP